MIECTCLEYLIFLNLLRILHCVSQRENQFEATHEIRLLLISFGIVFFPLLNLLLSSELLGLSGQDALLKLPLLVPDVDIFSLAA